MPCEHLCGVNGHPVQITTLNSNATPRCSHWGSVAAIATLASRGQSVEASRVVGRGILTTLNIRYLSNGSLFSIQARAPRESLVAVTSFLLRLSRSSIASRPLLAAPISAFIPSSPIELLRTSPERRQRALLDNRGERREAGVTNHVKAED